MAMLLFSFGEAFRTGTHKAMIFTYLRLRGFDAHGNDYYGHTRAWSQTGSAVSALDLREAARLPGALRSVVSAAAFSGYFKGSKDYLQPMVAALDVLQNLRKPVSVTVVAQRVPDRVLATVLSVESQLQSVLAAFVAFVVGAMAEAFAGNVGPGVATVAGLGLLALPLLWLRGTEGASHEQNRHT
ncbi:MAG: hypothetical protein ACOCZB_07175 [Spirochaetota bacterium]